jgi:branched-chain amino acid transport system ATP-binding protein
MSATLQRDAILEVDALAMRFGGLLAVDGVGFTARRGDITALIGPNGAGKTTVFNCITGFYRPTAGTLRLRRTDGTTAELERLKDHNIARAGVARTFQNIRLFPGMTLLENLLVAQHVVLNAATGFGVLALLGVGAYRRAEAAAVARAAAWLRATDLLARADDPAGALP